MAVTLGIRSGAQIEQIKSQIEQVKSQIEQVKKSK